MKVLCFLLCITYINCFYTDINQSRKEKIVGGDVAKIREESYFASLYYFEKMFCGASIISEDWFLSAEKCFLDKIDIRANIKVVTGSMHDYFRPLTGFSKIRSVKRYSDDFLDSNIDTNLALGLLVKSIAINRVQKPIPIAKSKEEPAAGSLMKIIGFGKTGLLDSETSNWLRKATVDVLKSEDCYAASDFLFCANTPHKDICYGDEGGPGIVDNKLVAIITAVPNCEYGDLPTVYTKVGAYYNWVRNITGLVL